MNSLRKLRALFRKEKLDAEMTEEMRHHLDAQMRRNLAAGMSLDEAYHAARRSFGGVEQIKERARDQRGWVWLEQLRQDVRYGFRALYKNPGFTIVAVLTLALGIGANTAAFTAINALVLNTLPVRAPDELVLVNRTGAASASAATLSERFSFPLYEQLRADAPSVPDLAAISYGTRTLVDRTLPNSDPEVVRSGEVTGNFFSVIAVSMALGRSLGNGDDRPGSPQANLVLSHGFWERRFASDPSVLGRTIALDDVAFTIVGVTSAEFTGVEVGGAMDVWLPLQMIRLFQPSDAPGLLKADVTSWLKLIGRLPPTMSREKAATEMNVVYQRHVAEIAARAGSQWEKSPQRRALDGRLTLVSGKGGYNNTVLLLRPLLASISAIVTLVLFLSCANVASLLLARATARQREFAIRLALGCGRDRLIRQVVSETMLLALAGGAGGLLLARWGLDVLVHGFFPADLVQASGFSLNPDARILVFTMTVAVATGLIVGLAPALRSSRLDLVTALKNQGAGTHGGRQRLGRFLVVTQIAVSVCLLAAAGLFVRTVQNLRDVDLGFKRENLLRIPLQTDRGLDATRRGAIARDMLQGLASLPAARSVTVADGAFRSGGRLRFDIDGYAPAPGEELVALPTFIGPGFFETAGITLVRGRAPEAKELLPVDARAAADTPGVVVISESLARKYFGTADPLGRTIRLSAPSATLEIVGVARDVMFAGARQKSPLVLFLPMARTLARQPTLIFYVRTHANPLALATEVRAVARRIAPGTPVRGPLWTMETMVDNQMFQERAIADVAGFFSVVALVLAAVGLYGVLAYNVARRTREIGVRMALGARAIDVQRLVVQQGARLALLGGVIGALIAIGLVRLASKLLFDVSPSDPLTLLATTAVLVAVALLASWLPARRAAKVDPMIALRCD